MLRIYKDSEGKIMLLNLVKEFFIPEDWTLVAEDNDPENPITLPLRKFRDLWYDDNGVVKTNLPAARARKLEEIREKRDEMLKKTDERFVEELSKGADTTAIQADKVVLRDLPAAAETALSSKIKDTTIDAYDAFADLSLSEEY